MKQSAPEGGGYNAMSVVQVTLLKVRAAAQEDLSQGSQLHTHSYTYLIEIGYSNFLDAGWPVKPAVDLL